jgi:hypothetical protein
MVMAHAAMRNANRLPASKVYPHDQRLSNGYPPPIQRQRFRDSPRFTYGNLHPGADAQESLESTRQDEGVVAGW